MRTGIKLAVICLGLSLVGCPADPPKKAEQTEKSEAAEAEKSTDKGETNELPEDVQKKLKSLGYVQ
jgi:hypothetical protein